MVLVGAIADALGVDVPALPVVATAPEYMEQKATLDAVVGMLAWIDGKRAALGI